MPRHRLGVVLLFDTEIANEIDALRELFGDASLAKIAPHITLVPPVNVREDELQRVVEILSAAARETESFDLTLGPMSMFDTEPAVLTLDVRGDMGALHALREKVFVKPLHRKLTNAYEPHVTVSIEIESTRALRAISDFSGVELDVSISAVCLMQETKLGPGSPRKWELVALFPFGVG